MRVTLVTMPKRGGKFAGWGEKKLENVQLWCKNIGVTWNMKTAVLNEVIHVPCVIAVSLDSGLESKKVRTCMYWQFIEIKNNYSTLHKRAYLFQKCNLVDAYRLKVSFINKKKITNSRTSQLPWKGTCTCNSKTSRWHHKCKNGTVGKAQLFHIGDLLSTFGNSGPEGVAFGEAQKCESKIL